MLVRALRRAPGPTWTAIAALLAAVSLPFGFALAFDASAWVVWGRELWSLDVDTGAGPSWKPFPLLITAPFALLGDVGAEAWLLTARAGALLAVVGAARLAARVGGGWGAAIAAIGVASAPWWLVNGALGNADPLLGALIVWALLALADGRTSHALALLVAGSLIRPEVWPFVVALAWWTARRGRVGWPVTVAAGAGVLTLWVVPDLLSSGLRSTAGATGTPSAGSAGLTDVPFLTVWADAIQHAGWPVALAAVLAAVGLRRAGDPRARPVAIGLGLVAGYVLLVAVMAQAGFAGNPRYLVPALTLLPAVAGGIVALARGRGGRAVIAGAIVAATLAVHAGDLGDQRALVGQRAASRDALERTIADAGGRVAVTRCGPVRTDPEVRSVVAELLRQPITDAGGTARPGDATLRPSADGAAWTLVPARC